MHLIHITRSLQSALLVSEAQTGLQVIIINLAHSHGEYFVSGRPVLLQPFTLFPITINLRQKHIPLLDLNKQHMMLKC